MPIWIYEIRPVAAVLMVVCFLEVVSLLGLFLTRRFVQPKLHYSDGINDAVSGTVQAIGVFYGITVGLIAVGVWNTYSTASDLVSKEAASIGVLFRDVSGYPEPLRQELRGSLREYTVFMIEKTWPAQQIGKGRSITEPTRIIDDFQSRLYSFEPKTAGQSALHSETLRAFSSLIEYRRLRIDAVDSGLSWVMWLVIWAGAAISIGVAYFFNIEDPKIHALLVALMAGFLALVLFMIVINDKPFYGSTSVSSAPYKLILERLIDLQR